MLARGATRIGQRRESRGGQVSMSGEPIRILLVGEAREARRLRGLLESNGSSQFRITHVPGMEPATECLAREDADVLLLDIGPDQSQGRAIVHAAASAAPHVPTVILSESENESLAVESLQQGAQDFLAKERLDRAVLIRALRYAIERHRLQKTLQSLTLIDDLTGLRNRRGFLALAEQHLRLILRKGAALLVYVDLDDLKSINDTYGHLVGNRALIGTANILRACFRQSDILARLGGDEFCVLMTDACQDSPLQVRKRLQQRVDFANALSTLGFRLSLSAGIVDVPVVRQPPLEELLRLADALMYEQKRNKRPDASVPVPLKHSTPA
jgi:two-component system cell cycle response regulator